MNDETRQHERIHGRSLTVLVFGDSATDLEFAALDEARKFFGPGPVLEVSPEWSAGLVPVEPSSGMSMQAGGKQYHARILVRAS